MQVSFFYANNFKCFTLPAHLMALSLYLTFIFIGIAILASLTVFFQPDANLYLKIFPYFLLISGTTRIVIGYLSFNMKDNIIVFNLLTTFEFCFYFFVLTQIIQNKKTKRNIFYFSLVYIAVALVNAVFIQKITNVLSISYSLGCLLIVAFSIAYFFELFELIVPINLLRQSSFWICSGLLFYFACSFPIFSPINLLRNAPEAIGKNLGIISNLLDVFLYSSFTIAFLCRIKIRKSTL